MAREDITLHETEMLWVQHALFIKMSRCVMTQKSTLAARLVDHHQLARTHLMIDDDRRVSLRLPEAFALRRDELNPAVLAADVKEVRVEDMPAKEKKARIGT